LDTVVGEGAAPLLISVAMGFIAGCEGPFMPFPSTCTTLKGLVSGNKGSVTEAKEGTQMVRGSVAAGAPLRVPCSVTSPSCLGCLLLAYYYALCCISG